MIGWENNHGAYFINELYRKIDDTNTNIGKMSDLATTNKDTIVKAVNEVSANIGALSNLTTIEKTNVVSAVNEVDTDLGKVELALNSIMADKSIYNDDYNNLKTTGIYLSTSGSNRPVAGWTLVLVIHPYHDQNGDIVWQLSLDLSTGNIYSRALNASTWSDWKRITFASS